MSLFRPEVFEHRRQKLHGTVNMALPVSWQAIGSLIFLSVVVAAIFISLATYSKTETITGQIVPKAGISQIVARRLGIVKSIDVTEGQFVSQGAVLMQIDTDIVMEGGQTESSQLLATLADQEQRLKNQQQQVAIATSESLSQTAARIRGLEADLAGLQDQILVQKELVASAKDQLEQAKKIAERGFISVRDIRVREETYLGRKQQLTQLQQTLALRRSSIEEARRAGRQTSASSIGEVEALSAQLADTLQRMNNVQASKSYQITAPVSGQVTALNVNIGQAVAPQVPLMSILPQFSKLEAKLYASTAAVSYMEVGNKVSIKIDQLGSVKAEIIDIADAPIVQNDPSGAQVPAYIITAKLDRSYISASGKNEKLLAGMALTASIQTRKQSLFRWLFEPLLEVQER